MIIKLLKEAGDFAENKDVAARLREGKIKPAIKSGSRVTLDFSGVTLTTQSFVHALISDVLRRNGEQVLSKLIFKGCSPAIRGIVGTVVQYSLETIDPD